MSIPREKSEILELPVSIARTQRLITQDVEPWFNNYSKKKCCLDVVEVAPTTIHSSSGTNDCGYSENDSLSVMGSSSMIVIRAALP